jgi:hypothetical protein
MDEQIQRSVQTSSMLVVPLKAQDHNLVPFFLGVVPYRKYQNHHTNAEENYGC